jgi:hypothetical protein
MVLSREEFLEKFNAVVKSSFPVEIKPEETNNFRANAISLIDNILLQNSSYSNTSSVRSEEKFFDIIVKCNNVVYGLSENNGNNGGVKFNKETPNDVKIQGKKIMQKIAINQNAVKEIFSTQDNKGVCRVWGRKNDLGYEIRLIFFNDISHTDFILFLMRTQEQIEDKIANLVKDNPEVLLGLFNQVFPNKNKYGENLKMDSNKFHRFMF